MRPSRYIYICTVALSCVRFAPTFEHFNIRELELQGRRRWKTDVHAASAPAAGRRGSFHERIFRAGHFAHKKVMCERERETVRPENTIAAAALIPVFCSVQRAHRLRFTFASSSFCAMCCCVFWAHRRTQSRVLAGSALR